MPSSFWEYVSRSTLKREVATGFLIWWIVIGTHLLWRVPTSQQLPDAALTTWAGLGVIVVGFATAAFGTDWISKQTTIAGPPMGTEIKTTTEITDTTATSTTTSVPTDSTTTSEPPTETKP